MKYTTADSLGSPRAVTSGTGGVLSRHDYLPFGEEVFAGTGGRTTAQGFNAADGIRKKFTGKERDDENGQDYFLARSFSPWQGRFTSVDPGPFSPADPQSWNRFTYVQNNPLKFTDPTGKTLVIIGDYADQLLAELTAKTGFGLLIDKKTGIVTIDNSVKRKREGTSTRMANLLRTIIRDSGTLKLRTMILPDQTPHAFVDTGSDDKEFYMDDYRAANSKDKKLGAILLAHVLREGYAFVVKNQHMEYPGGVPHELALVFESAVLSELTGQKEQKRVQTQLTLGSRIEYTSVAYDIYHKQDGGPPNSKTIILVNNKNCGCKRCHGQTIEFMLSARRDVSAAKRFFKKLMRADHRRLPFTIGTDEHASHPEAFAASVKEKVLPLDCKLRRVKYLNNVIE